VLSVEICDRKDYELIGFTVLSIPLFYVTDYYNTNNSFASSASDNATREGLGFRGEGLRVYKNNSLS